MLAFSTTVFNDTHKSLMLKGGCIEKTPINSLLLCILLPVRVKVPLSARFWFHKVWVAYMTEWLENFHVLSGGTLLVLKKSSSCSEKQFGGHLQIEVEHIVDVERVEDVKTLVWSLGQEWTVVFQRTQQTKGRSKEKSCWAWISHEWVDASTRWLNKK